jgi:uroporphyrinogen-III synthase
MPFIEVQAVIDLKIPTTDWIFFSSPKGARSYLAQYTILANKIAALGTGTASVLKEAGLNPDFIGESTDEPEIIGRKFNDLLHDNSTVFFPLGNRSKRSVVNEINSQKVQERITYKTLDQQHSLTEKHDVILFTSPSNYHSFIQSNKIAAHTQIIAMGKTTERAIKDDNAAFKLHTLTSPTEAAIISFLENLV